VFKRRAAQTYGTYRVVSKVVVRWSRARAHVLVDESVAIDPVHDVEVAHFIVARRSESTRRVEQTGTRRAASILPDMNCVRRRIEHRARCSKRIVRFDRHVRLDRIEHLRKLWRLSADLCPLLLIGVASDAIAGNGQSYTRDSCLSDLCCSTDDLPSLCVCVRNANGCITMFCWYRQDT
jgi:hypothetical protein